MPENSSCSGASSCSKESCEGCSHNSQNPQSMLEAMNAYSNIKHVIGVVSGKGGVGKSFVTSSLAVQMAKAGYKVGILDADITGPSIPKMFGAHGQLFGDEKGMYPYETKEGIKIVSINLLMEDEEAPVVWRGPVIAGAVKQFWNEAVWGDVDYLFVDMPPGTGDVPLTVFQSLPVDGIVIVTSPQELVQMIVKKAFHMANMMHIPVLGLVENFRNARIVERRSHCLEKATLTKLPQKKEPEFLANCHWIRHMRKLRMPVHSMRWKIRIWMPLWMR